MLCDDGNGGNGGNRGGDLLGNPALLGRSLQTRPHRR